MQKNIDRCRNNKTKLETEQSLKQERLVCRALMAMSFYCQIVIVVVVCFYLWQNFSIFARLNCL